MYFLAYRIFHTLDISIHKNIVVLDVTFTKTIQSAPFVGTVDWTRIASKLEKINYTGAIALETLNKGFEHIEKPVEFLQIALEKAKKL